MTPSQKVQAPTFDLAQYRAERRYVWREIEREDDEPLKVKLLRLNIRESDGIPFKADVQMAEIHEAIAPFVVEWNFRAENVETHEVVDVPPPAVVGGEVFQLMENGIGVQIATWLKMPRLMEREGEKKDLTSSESMESPPGNEKTE